MMMISPITQEDLDEVILLAPLRIALVSKLVRSRSASVRLLKLAEETLNLPLIKKIKRKVDKGLPLTSKEERLLNRINNLNGLSEVAYERSKGAPSGDFDLNVDLDNPIEVEKKKKRDLLFGDLDPAARKLMEKYLEETPSIKDQIRLDKEDIEENDPYGSSKPSLKVVGATKKILSKIKLIRRRAEANLQQLSDSQDPAERAAAKELNEAVQSALTPLEQSEELLNRIEPIVASLSKGTPDQVIRQLDQAIEEGLMGYRTWGSGINETLGPLRQRNEEVAKKLSSVLSTRLKEAVRMLREQGKTPEQAGEAAWELPAVQKLRFLVEGAKTKVKAYDLVIHEMASQYDSSRQFIRQLRQALTELRNQVSPERAAGYQNQAQKRLRQVAKRIVLLAYLRSKSL